MAILTSKNREALRAYKYKGGDNSYIYCHLLSPWAEYCVSFVPPTVAPNVITLAGLLFSVSSLVLTVIFNPNLEDGPRWLYLYTAAALFIYQTLDNMDGKQARKTGASSPLGLLFDHGCDAINAVTMVLPVASALGTGYSYSMLFCIYCAFIPFYVQTWEEYYREDFVLPVINGPSEGLLLTMLVCVISFFQGSVWWWTENILPDSPQFLRQVLPFIPTKLVPYHVFFSIGVLGAILTFLMQLFEVLAIANRKGLGWIHPLKTLSPFLAFTVSSWVWITHSKVFFTMPYEALFVLGSVFVEAVTHVMLMHVCNDKIKPFRRYTCWLLSIMAINVAFTDDPVLDERWLAHVFGAVSSLITAATFFRVCNEIAMALDIYVFRMGRRSKDAKHV